MDEIFPAGETNDEISMERCRELLGDEAADLDDDEIDRIPKAQPSPLRRPTCMTRHASWPLTCVASRAC